MGFLFHFGKLHELEGCNMRDAIYTDDANVYYACFVCEKLFVCCGISLYQLPQNALRLFLFGVSYGTTFELYTMYFEKSPQPLQK